MNSHDFDQRYFEDGIRYGVSLYKDFRWLPEVSIPMASMVKEIMGCGSILDYGCAKGFLVHALRLMGVLAYGYDISEYALKNCKKEIREYLYNNKNDVPSVSGIIVKDVLEHVSYNRIDKELKWICENCHVAFIIVPLGSDGVYRIEEYGFDRTHIIAENEEWWLTKFIETGFGVKMFRHRIPGIKDNWYEHNKIGNGFFLLKGAKKIL